MMGRRTAFVLIGLAVLVATAYGQNFKGTYTLMSGTAKLTLVLDQGSGGQVTGTLSSSTGATFQLKGSIQDDIVAGTCQGQAGTSQFEAAFEGSLLIFTLMETSPDGQVNSRSLEFKRAGGGGAGTADALGLPPAAPGPAAKPRGQSQAPAAPRPANPAPDQSSGRNVLSVPELGVSFAVPAGWNAQRQGEAVYLASTNYKGFIVITRHAYNNLRDMAKEASQGIVDQSSNTRLMPVSQFQPFGQNGMVAEFSGTAQGMQARSFAIGLISPQGGGVTIMAATEAASYSSDYSDFVLAIAGSLSFLPRGASGGAPMAGTTGAGGEASDINLLSYFAGEYYSYSSGATISGGAGTERTMTLCPDGNYRDSSEFSASGTGQWGAVNTQAGWGRWTVQGDKNQGLILVTYPNGQSRRIPYRVVSKQEQTISFDGVTYAFAGKPKCR